MEQDVVIQLVIHQAKGCLNTLALLPSMSPIRAGL